MDKDRKRGMRRAEAKRVTAHSTRKLKKLQELELHDIRHSYFPFFVSSNYFTSERRLREFKRDEGKYLLSRKYRNWEYDWEGYGLLVKYKKRLESMDQELDAHNDGTLYRDDSCGVFQYRRCWIRRKNFYASYSV